VAVWKIGGLLVRRQQLFGKCSCTTSVPRKAAGHLRQRRTNTAPKIAGILCKSNDSFVPPLAGAGGDLNLPKQLSCFKAKQMFFSLNCFKTAAGEYTLQNGY